MTQALTVPASRSETGLTKKELSDSKFFPNINTPAKSAVVADMAKAMGFAVSFVASNVTFINGKPATGAILLAAAIKRSEKYRYTVKEKSDKQCKIEFFERIDNKWESISVEVFSMQMATRAGLSGSATWKKYPEAMLYNRCLSAGAKAHCPDALAGYPIYLAEELLPPGTAVTEDGMPEKEAVEDAVIIPTTEDIIKLMDATGSKEEDWFPQYYADRIEDLTEAQRIDIYKKLQMKKEAN